MGSDYNRLDHESLSEPGYKVEKKADILRMREQSASFLENKYDLSYREQNGDHLRIKVNGEIWKGDNFYTGSLSIFQQKFLEIIQNHCLLFDFNLILFPDLFY